MLEWTFEILKIRVFVFNSERAGWIPTFGDLTYNLAAQYGWIYGLSVTEMEIVHGAYRKCNPNGELIYTLLIQKIENFILFQQFKT